MSFRLLWSNFGYVSPIPADFDVIAHERAPVGVERRKKFYTNRKPDGLGPFPSDSLQSQSYEFIEIAHDIEIDHTML